MFFQIMVFLNRRRPVSVSPSAKFFHSDTLIVAPFAVSETNTIRLPLNDANSGEAAPDIFVFPVIKAAETYKNNIHHLCGSEVMCVCVCVCAKKTKHRDSKRHAEVVRSPKACSFIICQKVFALEPLPMLMITWGLSSKKPAILEGGRGSKRI